MKTTLEGRSFRVLFPQGAGHLAQAYESNGETDLAIDELTRALDEVPSFAEREATEEMLRKLRSS